MQRRQPSQPHASWHEVKLGMNSFGGKRPCSLIRYVNTQPSKLAMFIQKCEWRGLGRRVLDLTPYSRPVLWTSRPTPDLSIEILPHNPEYYSALESSNLLLQKHRIVFCMSRKNAERVVELHCRAAGEWTDLKAYHVPKEVPCFPTSRQRFSKQSTAQERMHTSQHSPHKP